MEVEVNYEIVLRFTGGEIPTFRDLIITLNGMIDPVKLTDTAYKNTTIGYKAVTFSEPQKELIKTIHGQITTE